MNIGVWKKKDSSGYNQKIIANEIFCSRFVRLAKSCQKTQVTVITDNAKSKIFIWYKKCLCKTNFSGKWSTCFSFPLRLFYKNKVKSCLRSF